jgi:hypothetical protein
MAGKLSNLLIYENAARFRLRLVHCETVAGAVTQQVMALGGGEGEGEARRTVLMRAPQRRVRHVAQLAEEGR